LRLWHLTSLDAPTVAIIWTLAFAWAARVRLPLWLPAVTGLSAWSFYIADRLLDARAARSPLRLRHHFHHRHRRIFLILAAAAAMTALGLVLRCMPPLAQARNTLLAAAALAYFTGVHTYAPRRRLLPKELLVALVFTAACAAPVLSRAAHRLELAPVFLVFTALAWLNCGAIEAWESQRLVPAHWASIFRVAVSLAAACLLAAMIAVVLGAPRIALLLAAAGCSAVLLALLDRGRRRLTPTTLRAAADLVLLTPLALLCLA
jgi:hypothetical protein